MTNKRKDGKCTECLMEHCRCKDLAEAKNKLEGWKERIEAKIKAVAIDHFNGKSIEPSLNKAVSEISNLLSLQRREIREVLLNHGQIVPDRGAVGGKTFTITASFLDNLTREIESNKENK